ncbi:energy-coupling factor transporter ATP-binding protein EcfA2 [Streptosporangium becharense]|uniref:Energy-coupling factor transporter ATP-binding protein EcfA2 n=1 Tax=Streptosporangium becharense TaxID=1816182 RepID=A0A7W9II67_9ACTN|nr:dynamin family protein [Streptosporangium becharense]MBB2914719.1 energy-coupling factor transporter ATP-binding protein EcfA2 [Streptosporangium becharense]MBB5820880.1 energy-coupling factor transporter ATP-binding protein EcfA2 [Streptosporangium becharense]
MGDNGLLGTLRELRRLLDRDLFPLVVGDTAADRGALRELTGQLDDYLIPRLGAIDAPLLAVVGGSTGAGKSTLVNSLVGADVCEPGVLRPTTLAPTLVTSPADREWFLTRHVLPGLPRVTGSGRGEPGTLRIVTVPGLPPGLALLDAPDIDSVVAANRELAAQLLAAADLWLFTTTAARYADEVPWSFLRSARERSTALAVILSRVPPEALGVVDKDLTRLLTDNGLGGTRLFEVPELVLPQENARLPRQAVQPIVGWLTAIAADARSRAEVVRQTLSGALDSLATRVPALAAAVDRQYTVAEELRAMARSAYAAGLTSFDDGMLDGSLLRGEVLARWQDFIGTGDLMRSLETRVGRLRDRLVALFTGRPAPENELRVALESGVEALIRASADGAAERLLESWSSHPAGRALLEGQGVAAAGRLGRASADLPARAETAVREWQGYVLDLVRKEGADKRTTARLTSFGVNGAGLLLMLAVFASTGGLTGIEVGIAGGTSVLSQKLLEAVFGDQAVRTLTIKARSDLRARVVILLGQEAARFTGLIDAVQPPEGVASELRATARAVRDHLREAPGGVPRFGLPPGPAPGSRGLVSGTGDAAGVRGEDEGTPVTRDRDVRRPSGTGRPDGGEAGGA